MGRMVRLDDFIKELQEIHPGLGNTCVYIRDVSYGAVALNRRSEDRQKEIYKMRKIRAKFEVISVENGTVTMEPRYDETIPEDQRFNEATPWGKLEMSINNPLALEQLKPGRAFYLDLVPVEDDKA